MLAEDASYDASMAGPAFLKGSQWLPGDTGDVEEKDSSSKGLHHAVMRC